MRPETIKTKAPNYIVREKKQILVLHQFQVVCPYGNLRAQNPEKTKNSLKMADY